MENLLARQNGRDCFGAETLRLELGGTAAGTSLHRKNRHRGACLLSFVSIRMGEVVALRSASVMIQILVPFDKLYAESRRSPCSRDHSFARRSWSSSSPQSPAACQSKRALGKSPASSNAASAPGVATICPSGNLCRLTPGTAQVWPWHDIAESAQAA